MAFTMPNYPLFNQEQSSPYAHLISNALNTYQSGVESKYKPQMVQADIFHKMFSPLAAIASNPLLWSVMSSDQQKNIADLISRTIGGMSNGGGISTGGGIFSGGGTPNNGGEMANAGTGTSTGTGTYIPTQESGQGTRAPDSMVNDISLNGNNSYNQSEQPKKVLPPTQFNRNAPAFNIPGTTGAANPIGISKAQQAGLESSATGEAQAQQETFKTMYNESAEAGKTAQNNLMNLQKFNAAYDNLEPVERGPLGGKIPALSTAAQEADMSSNALADSVARAQQTGHITQLDRQTYQGIKVGRTNTPEAKKSASEFITGMNLREQERLPFVIAGQKAGLNPQEINAVWQSYIAERPFYNAKEHKKSDDLNTWPEFFSPKKLAEIFNPTSRKKEQVKNSNKKVSEILDDNRQGQQRVDAIKRIGKKEYHKIAGQWLPVLGGA